MLTDMYMIHSGLDGGQTNACVYKSTHTRLKSTTQGITIKATYICLMLCWSQRVGVLTYNISDSKEFKEEIANTKTICKGLNVKRTDINET